MYVCGAAPPTLTDLDNFARRCQLAQVTRMAARWEVGAALRTLNKQRQAAVSLGNHIVRPFSIGTVRRASAGVYAAITAQMDAFLAGIKDEVAPSNGSMVRALAPISFASRNLAHITAPYPRATRLASYSRQG